MRMLSEDFKNCFPGGGPAPRGSRRQVLTRTELQESDAGAQDHRPEGLRDAACLNGTNYDDRSTGRPDEFEETDATAKKMFRRYYRLGVPRRWHVGLPGNDLPMPEAGAPCRQSGGADQPR